MEYTISMFDRLILFALLGSIVAFLFTISMNLFKVYSTQRMAIVLLNRLLGETQKKD